MKKEDKSLNRKLIDLDKYVENRRQSTQDGKKLKKKTKIKAILSNNSKSPPNNKKSKPRLLKGFLTTTSATKIKATKKKPLQINLLIGNDKLNI